mgnify:CR=1 FL=1
MRSVRLLDCTLRDGGYHNDWEFGQNEYLSIYQRLVAANVDVIEVGFIDDRRPYDINKTIFPDTKSIGMSYGAIKDKAPISVGMIDYGTCSIDNLQDASESWVDGIRVIFKKKLMHEAMEYCRQVKAKGYKVFSQLVAVSDYKDEDFVEIAKLINDVKPYAVSMVDTYGLLYPEDVKRIFGILDKTIDKDVSFGFHAHNNLQLGYANTIAFIQAGDDRDIIADATLFGMGKSAGNAPIELVADYMNKHNGKDYAISQVLEAIEESVLDLYKKYSWGYKTFFYLAAKNEVHPNFVGYFQDKCNYSVSDIDEVLNKEIDEPSKLAFDKKKCDAIYDNFRATHYSDQNEYERLMSTLSSRSILVIGPGKNIILQKDKVDRFVKENDPVCISVNYIPKDLDVDYVFITKPKRYAEMTVELLAHLAKGTKIIATSNVASKNEKFEYLFDREPLLERDQNIIDNSFLMLAKILERAGVKKVACAGMDGYSNHEDNYFDVKMEYQFVKKESQLLNNHIREVLEQSPIEFKFVTYSHYEEREN